MPPLDDDADIAAMRQQGALADLLQRGRDLQDQRAPSPEQQAQQRGILGQTTAGFGRAALMHHRFEQRVQQPFFPRLTDAQQRAALQQSVRAARAQARRDVDRTHGSVVSGE